MAFEDGRKYPAVCVAAEFTQSLKVGTEGIELTFNTDEGTTTHTLWLTDKNRPQVYRSLAALGIADPTAFDLAGEDLQQLVGRKCSLKMGADEYQGKSRIVVQWINSPTSSVELQKAARFFPHAGKKAVAVAVTLEVTDDDVPF
jgi:hypothetical protein